MEKHLGTTNKTNSQSYLTQTIYNHYNNQPQQEDLFISIDLLKNILRKAANFKTPGPDKVQKRDNKKALTFT